MKDKDIKKLYMGILRGYLSLLMAKTYLYPEGKLTPLEKKYITRLKKNEDILSDLLYKFKDMYDHN